MRSRIGDAAPGNRRDEDGKLETDLQHREWTLRVKPDRRRLARDMPPDRDRRGQPSRAEPAG